MKKIYLKLLFSVLIAVIIGFNSCATLNEENFSRGTFLDRVLTNHYDSSIPIEEQCYLIVLNFYTTITLINGEKAGDRFGMNESPNASLNCNQITILPPGQHRFNFLYYRTSGNVSYTARGSGTYNLQAGHYYFLATQASGNQVRFILDDLEKYSSVTVYGFTLASSEIVSANAVIEAINAKIASQFEGFKGGGRTNNNQSANENEPPKLMIINQLTIPISHVYISPAGENAWVNILRTPVSPGTGLTYDMSSRSRHDIKVEDSNGNTYTFLNVDFSGADSSVGKMFVIETGKQDK